MLAKRIVPCLDVDDGRVVKGVRFQDLRDAGDPVELARVYATEGADELVFLDISATSEGRRTAAALAERVARELFVPFTVGGGLRTMEGMREVLHAGADRVAINTAAVRDPSLIARAADRFGSQAIVVSIDAQREGTGWRVFVRAGSEDTDLDAVDWAARAAELGAGEILLTSIDRDGTREGYDLELLRAVRRAVGVPVIASGGAGRPRDFAHAFRAGANAALAASLFHFGEVRIPALKAWLAAEGIPVRPAPEEGGSAPPEEGRVSEPEELRFDPETGLVPAVIRSLDDGTVRMLGYMDREALARTLSSGRVVFYSRSRGSLWEKGETSGHWLEPVRVRTDCDGDALLVDVRAHGPTCHRGTRSCFEAGHVLLAPRADPPEWGGQSSATPAPRLAKALEALVEVVAERDRERPSGSGTAALLEGGVPAAARKVGEEALETVLAALAEPERLAEESADLLYHLVVLWRAAGLGPGEVARVLIERRER